MLSVLRSSPCLPLRRRLCRCFSPGTSQYSEPFARRMAMAGIKPHHQIALGVSGGPDSMALCVLTAGWKLDGSIGKNESSGFIDGLLAIVVDHRLRAESTEEAILVRDRIQKLGVKCVIESCDWPGGRPPHGHLQESAREMRYQIFENVCVKQHIRILLIAHHADDQAELLILRLSRNSGVLGLAGMAFITQLFPILLRFRENSSSDGIFLVRPMLELTKDDMYTICGGANLEWVEDPSNQSSMFARNRIRASLRKLSSDLFQLELRRFISACRLARAFVENLCRKMIEDSVTIMEQHGYAVIDLEKLKPVCVDDLCLSRYLAWILQFISQRHKPIRGSVSQLLLGYIRNFPCKVCSRCNVMAAPASFHATSLTAAGCYLSPAPHSKGAKLMVCCFANPRQPFITKLSHEYALEEERSLLPSELRQIVSEAKFYSDQFLLQVPDVELLHAKSSKAILTEARKLNFISDLTLQNISLLQEAEYEKFSSKEQVQTDYNLTPETKCVSPPSISIRANQSCFFMDRFSITWKVQGHGKRDGNFWKGKQEHSCQLCMVTQETTLEIRPMVEKDWLFLADVSKKLASKHGHGNAAISVFNIKRDGEQEVDNSIFVQLSAKRALKTLKSIPTPVRKGLPVLVTSEGLLLSIPCSSQEYPLEEVTVHIFKKLTLSNDFRLFEVVGTCCMIRF